MLNKPIPDLISLCDAIKIKIIQCYYLIERYEAPVLLIGDIFVSNNFIFNKEELLKH